MKWKRSGCGYGQRWKMVSVPIARRVWEYTIYTSMNAADVMNTFARKHTDGCTIILFNAPYAFILFFLALALLSIRSRSLSFSYLRDFISFSLSLICTGPLQSWFSPLIRSSAITVAIRSVDFLRCSFIERKCTLIDLIFAWSSESQNSLRLVHIYHWAFQCLRIPLSTNGFATPAAIQ